MKTIIFTKGTDNNTMTMAVGDETPRLPSQLVSVHNVPSINRGWIRNVQVSPEFVMIKRAGCPSVGYHLEDLIAMAVAVEPGLSWPPIFVTQPETDPQGHTISVNSELPGVTYQWQSSEDGQTWKDVEGQRGTGFNQTGFKFIRCIATNGAGSTASNSCQLPQ